MALFLVGLTACRFANNVLFLQRFSSGNVETAPRKTCFFILEGVC